MGGTNGNQVGRLQPSARQHCVRRWPAVALAALSLLALTATTGCSNTPDFASQRQEVRAIQQNNAVAAHDRQVALATSPAAKSHGRRTGDLCEDGYRAIRYAIAKPSVTPRDAARLPYGSNKVLMRFLHDERFRRYGPAMVNLLAMIGGDEELAFLRDYLENEAHGGVDEYAYRTLLAIPTAIGYLAIHNDHAYAALRDYLRLQFWRENIAWRFTAKDRDLNAYRMVMASLDGIAISGRRTAVPYVEYIIEHECGTEGGRAARTRTLMDERLEARAQNTVNSLGLAN